MKKTFVYSPRSASRFIYGAGPRKDVSIPCVVWENGSAHIVGLYRIAHTYASQPRAWWRDEARLLAKYIAVGSGGYAWDIRGHVFVAVPDHFSVPAALAFAIAHPGELEMPYPVAKALGVSVRGIEEMKDVIQAVGVDQAWPMALEVYGKTVRDAPHHRYVYLAEHVKVAGLRIVHIRRPDARLGEKPRVEVAAPERFGEPLVYGAEPRDQRDHAAEHPLEHPAEPTAVCDTAV